MQFTLTNVGPVKKAIVGIAPLTIICGKNNAGKTYLVNAITEFYSMISRECSVNVKEDIVNNDEMEVDLQKYLALFIQNLQKWAEKYNKIGKELHGGLFELNVTDTDFCIDAPAPSSTWSTRSSEGAKFEVRKEGPVLHISRLTSVKDDEQLNVKDVKDQWHAALNSIVNGYLSRQVYNGGAIGDVFSMTSERMGVAYFKDSLDIAVRSQAKILDPSSDEHMIPSSEKNDTAKQLFPNAIVRMLDFTSWIGQRKRAKLLKLSAFGKLFDLELKNLIGGSYTVDDGSIIFTPSTEKVNLEAQESSSSVRALFLLDSYLRYAAEKGDLLVVDEPEMNLHPEKQRQLARFLAKVVNAGVKVFITTHSDYIVREFNTLMMLKDDDERVFSLRKKYRYDKSELLDVASVNGYYLQDGFLHKLPMSQESGMEVASFDDTTRIINTIQNDVLFGEENHGSCNS